MIEFSEEDDRARFVEKVGKRFRTKDILSVTIFPHSTYGLPKKRKIGVDQAGNQAWEITRSDLVDLSRCLKEAYGSVEVNALVKYGG
jgi:hypothetical protein